MRKHPLGSEAELQRMGSTHLWHLAAVILATAALVGFAGWTKFQSFAAGLSSRRPRPAGGKQSSARSAMRMRRSALNGFSMKS